MAGDKSLAAKYSEIFPGQEGALEPPQVRIHHGLRLRHARAPWAISSGKSSIPGIFKEVGRGCVFGRSITFRHPHKIRIGAEFVHRRQRGPRRQGRGERGDRHRGKRLYRPERHPELQGRLDRPRATTATSPPTARSFRRPRSRLGKYCFLAGNCYLVAGGNHSFVDLATARHVPALALQGRDPDRGRRLARGRGHRPGRRDDREEHRRRRRVGRHGLPPGIFVRPRRPPAQDLDRRDSGSLKQLPGPCL